MFTVGTLVHSGIILSFKRGSYLEITVNRPISQNKCTKKLLVLVKLFTHIFSKKLAYFIVIQIVVSIIMNNIQFLRQAIIYTRNSEKHNSLYLFCIH